MYKKILSLLLCMIFITSLSLNLAEEIGPFVTANPDSYSRPIEGLHHYLLLCTDQWDYESNRVGNTDGIVLMSLDTRAKRLMLTSFSRDILINKPDGKPGRITFIAKNHGPETLCKLMSSHFGIKIEKYIMFSMKHIENIIDYLGGIDIDVTDAEARYLRRYAISPTSTVPSMAEAGKYHFFGHAAVIYMRIRKVGNGDYGRTLRVRSVLSKLANKAMQYNKDQAFKLLDAIIDNIGDSNLSTADFLSAVSYCLDLRGAKVEQLRIPEDNAHQVVSYAGMTVMNIDYEKARQAISSFMGDNFTVID